MEIATVYAEAISKAISSSREEVKRDLAVLLPFIEEGDNDFSRSQVTTLLSGNSSALSLFDEIQAVSQNPSLTEFGPVLATEAAAAERLALNVMFRLSSLLTDAKDFVERSDVKLLDLFEVAKETQNYLGGTTLNGIRWARIFTPNFLQKIFEDSSVLLELTVASTGGELSDAWSAVQSWIEQWSKFLEISPQINKGGDGFFQPLYSGHQPTAIHPLTLRVLRKSFLSKLGIASQDEINNIQAFCLWLVDGLFYEGPGNQEQQLTEIKLESVFATASLVLSLAKQQGITVEEDGQLTVSEGSTFWGELSERILQTIVNNCQQVQTTPPFWKDQVGKVRQLIYTCPEWHTVPLLFNLRARAAQLLDAQLEKLKFNILEEDSKITEDKIYQRVELLPLDFLPDLRPREPVFRDSSDKGMYTAKLNKFSSEIKAIEEFDTTIKAINANVTQARIDFEQRLISPLAEPALPNLAALNIQSSNDWNLALTTYLRQSISQIALDSKVINSGNSTQETLANQPAWVSAINQTATANDAILSGWSTLEVWDGLRGRLAQPPDNPGDKNVTVYLNQQLPEWLAGESELPTNIDFQKLRPILAELAHLGVSLQQGTYASLTERLETLLGRDDLDNNFKSPLAAMRLELGVTAISVGMSPSDAFKVLGTLSEDNLSDLVKWIKSAAVSNNAWEARAGMNGTILLSRLIEGSGDLYLRVTLKSAMTERTSSLVNQSIETLLSDSTGNSSDSRGANLPLTLAAFDLASYARDFFLGLQSQDDIKPAWAESSPKDLINALVVRLGTSPKSSLGILFAEGDIGMKLLLISLLQIKLDELNWERQLILKPLQRKANGADRHDQLLQQIDGLQKTVRFLFCREQVLLTALPKTVSEVQPWWQTRYWLSASLRVLEEDFQLTSEGPLNADFEEDLEEQVVSDSLRIALSLSAEASIRIIVRQIDDDNYERKWLVLDPQQDTLKTYLIQKTDNSSLSVFSVGNTSAILFNWAASYTNNIEANLLNLSSRLESSIPQVSENNDSDIGLDIDGRYAGEFPDWSWKKTTENLENASEQLKEIEEKYNNALQQQIEGQRTNEIIDLLKQPLFLNTADYREQMMAAIAEVRKAEVELEVAEFEALATDFEVFAHEMLYKAAKVELDRQDALVMVSEKDKEISDLDLQIRESQEEQIEEEVNIAERNIKIAKLATRKVFLEKEKVEIARQAIKEEITLLRELLQDDVEIDGFTVKGQIGVMALQVEKKLITQLETKKKEAEAELKRAQDAEAERKKKAKRRRLIGGVCRFIGAAVGCIIGGGPAGAALGAEIGGAIGELTNGIIENKAPEEILVGLIDNGFAIAKTAGVDLEKELNLLGAKGAEQLDQFLGELDSSLEPLLDSLPNILDEKLFDDALFVLGFEEIPNLKSLVEKSYEDLRDEIPNLGRLGTALKAIKYDSPHQFLDYLGSNLFENTVSSAREIEALSKAIGKQVEDLQTEEGLKDAAGRFAKLLLAEVGQKAANFRQGTIVNWIQNNRENKRWWDDPIVRAEAAKLVKDLFPDEERQKELLDNLESSLINPEIVLDNGEKLEIIKGKIQEYLHPWQQKLDEKLDEMTAFNVGDPPRSAVQAAEQSVRYLEECIESFNQDLLPWLKGESQERRDLLVKLDELENEKLPQNNIDLEIGEIEEQISRINENNAIATLQIRENQLEEFGLLYQSAELKVSKASLLNKVANLAKLREANRAEEKKKLLEASLKRQEGAQSKVKAARLNIEVRHAEAQAAMRRGAEASRIRGVLGRPALRLPNLSADATTRLRSNYVEALLESFRWYRELLRFYYAAGATEIPTIQRSTIQTDDSKKWSKAFEFWQEQAIQGFNTAFALDDPQTVEWDLTPEQIAALLSPDGFRMLFASDILENPTLFTVPAEWKSYLEGNNLVNSPWIKAFAQAGINLSGEISAEIDESGPNWKIIDNQTGDILVSSYQDNGAINHRWNITKEHITYTVILPPSGSEEQILKVTRRQEPPLKGRSPLSNQYWVQISPEAAETGRIVGAFLEANIEGTAQKITEDDYQIDAKHLGDSWLNKKQVKLLHQAKKLEGAREIFLTDGRSPIDTLTAIRDFTEIEGEPTPFTVQGMPLSGTLSIRLRPLGVKQFNAIKLKVLYKYYNNTVFSPLNASET